MSLIQAGFDPMLAAPRRWDFLAGLMLQLGLRSFVEVGCKEGRTTGFILKNVPDSTVTAIDPWRQMPEQKGVGETYEKWDFDKIEKDFWENVGENKGRCTMLRETSEEAATRGDTFDIAFIDASHDYESVRKDISLWLPKVRSVIAGHDFNHKWPGVERAVADDFNLMDVGIGPDSVWFVVKQ